MTNTQTPTILRASDALTVIFDGFDTDNTQIGLGDPNAEHVIHLTVTRDFFIEVRDLGDGIREAALMGTFGQSGTVAVPADTALTVTADLPYRDREAIAHAIQALITFPKAA